MLSWLDVIKRSVSPVTFSSYSEMVKGITVPYFRKTGIRLSDLKPRDIKAFYDEKIKTVSANSVIHYHANIYSHLDYTAKLNSAETLVTSLDFALEPKLLPG